MIVLAFLNKDKIKTWQAWGIVGLLVGITALGDGKILIFTILAVGCLFLKERPVAREKALKTFLPLILGGVSCPGFDGVTQ